MTLTTTRRLRPSGVIGYVTLGTAIDVLENTAEAQPLTFDISSADWTYSAAAEGRTGEVAVRGVDMDGEPGLIYAGQNLSAVHIQLKDCDLLASEVSLLAPEATDGFNVGLYVNNDLIAGSDEGATIEMDTATVEFNASGYVGNLIAGDVLRVAVIASSGNEDGVKLKLNGGSVLIID